jgi:hypothetical protein
MSDTSGAHRSIRRAMLPYAPGSPCARCGRPILEGQPVHLDHRDDRSGYLGFSHARCNEQAGARLGNQRRRAARERTRIMVDEVALGIEVSEDRQHCSIVAAGHLDGDLILLDLVAYLDGTDPVGAVQRLRGERKVLAVVVDPHSHAATAIRPLEAAQVKVTKPASTDVVVAHGGFLDALAAGRVRHAGQAELTAAARHLQQRRLGGASAPERRGAPVDVAPAVAAELAAWALENAPRPVAPDIF